MARSRDTRIDLIKSVAIVLVILIHACFYSDPVESGQFAQVLGLGALARPAVPLFFMCSGALMIRPEQELSLKKLLGHSLLRLVLAMLVWAMAYKLWEMRLTGYSLSAVWEAVKQVFTFQQEFHFYYLHIIFLVYLALPITHGFVRAASPRLLRYALGFWFVFGILAPTAQQFWPFSLITGMPRQWALNLTYAAIGYGVLGWYLRAHPLPGSWSGALLAAGYALTFLPTLLLSRNQGYLYEGLINGTNLGPCLMSVGAYCLMLRCRPGEGFGRVVTFVSRGSFCVYLAHVFFLSQFGLHGYPFPALPRIPQILAVTAATLAASLALYWVLSKIPVVKRWLI